MALERVHESDGEDDYHSLSGRESEAATNDLDPGAESVEDAPPVHPVPAMQGAFEESILESMGGGEQSSTGGGGDAEARRHRLLEDKDYDDSWTTRWKQQPGAQHHPLLKLMAQIIFGMDLIQQQQAKSIEEVVKILQTHVTEVDSFLERTSDDFDIATTDLKDRIQHLMMPLSHLETFTTMLDDKPFRTQLLEGNDRIEKIIERTAKAMNAALMDVQRGLQATRQLGTYLTTIKDSWPRHNQDLMDVFGAMRGNEQGWLIYLNDLQAKGNHLGNFLVQLGTLISEMAKLAAAASRRNRPQSTFILPIRPAPTSPGLRSKYSTAPPSRGSHSKHATIVPPVPVANRPSVRDVLNKPLPREPDAVSDAAQATMPSHPVPFAQRYETPRATPRSPPSRNFTIPPLMTDARPQRPKSTASLPHDARTSRRSKSELINLSQRSQPLTSSPLNSLTSTSRREEGRRRSQSMSSHKVSDTRVAGANGDSNGQMGIVRLERRAYTHLSSRPRSAGNVLDKSSPSSRSLSQALTSTETAKPGPDWDKELSAFTGFSQRISKRMRYLPQSSEPPQAGRQSMIEPPNPPVASSPPADSAYASDLEQPPQPSLRTNASWPKSTPRRRPPPATSARKRPPSRFSFFFGADEPDGTTPSPAANLASTGASGLQALSSSASTDKTVPDVPSAVSMKSHRLSGVKTILHRKLGSRSTVS